MRNVAHKHLAGWAGAAVRAGASSSESFVSGALYALVAVVKEEAEWSPKPDDALTPESFAVGRWDAEYLRHISRGGVFNYAAWLRGMSRRVELERPLRSLTSEEIHELNYLDLFLDV